MKRWRKAATRTTPIAYSKLITKSIDLVASSQWSTFAPLSRQNFSILAVLCRSKNDNTCSEQQTGADRGFISLSSYRYLCNAWRMSFTAKHLWVFMTSGNQQTAASQVKTEQSWDDENWLHKSFRASKRWKGCFGVPGRSTFPIPDSVHGI